MHDYILIESVKKMPLMQLPVRSVCIPVNKGKVLFSPGSNLSTPDLKSVGEVTDVVAPNLFHCAGIPKALAVFPDAKIWGAKGVSTEKKNVPWSQELSSKVWPYQEELPLIEIAGMPKVNETVFIHKKSKSLLVTDLCFNLLDQKGIGPWLILNMFGTYQKFGISKFFLKFVKDRKAFNRSLQELFSHDFDNILVSHGHNIIGNGKKKLRDAFLERNISV